MHQCSQDWLTSCITLGHTLMTVSHLQACFLCVLFQSRMCSFGNMVVSILIVVWPIHAIKLSVNVTPNSIWGHCNHLLWRELIRRHQRWSSLSIQGHIVLAIYISWLIGCCLTTNWHHKGHLGSIYKLKHLRIYHIPLSSHLFFSIYRCS